LRTWRCSRERIRVTDVRALGVLPAVAVVALAAALGAQARVGTGLGLRSDVPPYMSSTASKNVTVLVVIDDGGITIHKFRQAGAGSGASLETLEGPVPRGDLVTFNVYNHGKTPHNFAIFGKTTAALKPGRTTHLYFAVKAPGRFLYRSTLDRGKSFQGYLTVQ
jgi:hypothetical protein